MQTIADRVRELERRVATLESALQPHPRPAPVPAREPPPEPAPEVVIERRRPQPVSPLEEVRPPARPPRAPRSLEVDFGRWMSRLGGAALVVAAGFLFAYAAKRGWLNPSLRVVAGLVGGAALVAAGEWHQRRLKSFAAALTGAGIGVLYVSVYAGYAFLDFFSVAAALALATAITGAGAWQALRHDTEAVAGLAAVGGFLAPALVLDFHAHPLAILAYVLVLNGGLFLLRARKGWISIEIIAWLGTPLVAAVPLTHVELAWGLGFLLANVALFGVRPRLRPDALALLYTLGLSAVTALASYVLFDLHGTPGWAWFAGGMAVTLAASAWLTERRAPAVAAGDTYAAIGFAALAILDGVHGWQQAVGWSALAAALLLVPLRRLGAPARHGGLVVALLAVVHLAARDAWVVEYRMLAFLSAGAAVAALRRREAYLAGVVIAALGVAAQVAAVRGADPWATLALVTRETARPTTRLLVGATFGALLGLYGTLRRERALGRFAAVYVGMLAAAEAVFLVDGVGYVPAGLVAAATLLLLPREIRFLPVVGAAFAVALLGDFRPPFEALPFCHRRFFALLAVLGAGWALLRDRERRASLLAVAALVLLGEALCALDGDPQLPLGLLAAMALFFLPAPLRSIWAVAAALALAVSADLIPPAGYLPFLNRRAFAVGAVLASGCVLLRGRAEGRASLLLLLLLGAAEIASVPDAAAGRSPWHYLVFGLRGPEGMAPFWNVRFLFLAGAAAVSFYAARRWRPFTVLGHVYLLFAVGAEVVGLVRPPLRATVWPIFRTPSAYMGPHLALTGVLLGYGAALVTAGILKQSALARRTGLAMLLAGGAKVSVLDLAALGDLYRVGSFLVLGVTYLLGSYAYNRWVTPDAGPGGP